MLDMREQIDDAAFAAESRWEDAQKVWDAGLSTNDPAIASALIAIAAELRAHRIERAALSPRPSTRKDEQ